MFEKLFYKHNYIIYKISLKDPVCFVIDIFSVYTVCVFAFIHTRRRLPIWASPPEEYKKSIDAKHQRATPKEFDPGLHLNT
jgi:hypothetical protein